MKHSCATLLLYIFTPKSQGAEYRHNHIYFVTILKDWYEAHVPPTIIDAGKLHVWRDLKIYLWSSVKNETGKFTWYDVVMQK